MPDLYNINLHLQETLERDWLDEVRAVEAAHWLDEVGLLKNSKGGLPLRKLLRAGRIAGQEQRPDEECGSWFIRRLADSPNPEDIHRARERMRAYLPLERRHLHPDWPLSRDNPDFWEEIGKTVAMFGNLENTLASCCYGLTQPPADITHIQPKQIKAYLNWYAEMEEMRTNSLGVLTDRFMKLLEKDGRVPHAARAELCQQMNELRPWRNALCHGAWFGVSGDGDGVLCHFYKENNRIVRFPAMVSLKDLASLRVRLVDIILRVSESASIAGYNSVFAAALPRRYEPRNVPPESG